MGLGSGAPHTDEMTERSQQVLQRRSNQARPQQRKGRAGPEGLAGEGCPARSLEHLVLRDARVNPSQSPALTPALHLLESRMAKTPSTHTYHSLNNLACTRPRPPCSHRRGGASLAPLQKWPKICQDPGVIRPVAASVPQLRECPADSCGQCQSHRGHVAGLLRADPTGCPITGLGTTPRALQPAPGPSPPLQNPRPSAAWLPTRALSPTKGMTY